MLRSDLVLKLKYFTFLLQKYFVLRAKKGLITDGLFSRSRNPNYLGEGGL